MRLTEISIRNLPSPPSGQVTYFDDTLPGFGVRVSAKGNKSFTVLIGRARRRVTIGRFPIIGLHDARTRARELLAERILGKEEVPALKFEDAIPVFLNSHFGDHYIKPRTKNEAERVLRRNFLPRFRHRQVSDIKAYEVAEIIDTLRKTPSMAHHAFGTIRQFFRWAEGRRYVLRTPCAALKPPRKGQPRERVLSRDEVQCLLSIVRESESQFHTIVELLLYTGQRRGEIAALRADWIDWRNRTITFPGKITKNKRPHTLPFGPHVESLLHKGEAKGLLFPARRTEGERPFDGWSKCKPKLERRCALPYWTLHDLRRTYASNMAELGVPVHVTERLLNHVSGTMGGIVAVYQRYSYQKEMREAMELWENELQHISMKGQQSNIQQLQVPMYRAA